MAANRKKERKGEEKGREKKWFCEGGGGRPKTDSDEFDKVVNQRDNQQQEGRDKSKQLLAKQQQVG